MIGTLIYIALDFPEHSPVFIMLLVECISHMFDSPLIETFGGITVYLVAQDTVSTHVPSSINNIFHTIHIHSMSISLNFPSQISLNADISYYFY